MRSVVAPQGLLNKTIFIELPRLTAPLNESQPVSPNLLFRLRPEGTSSSALPMARCCLASVGQLAKRSSICPRDFSAPVEDFFSGIEPLWLEASCSSRTAELSSELVWLRTSTALHPAYGASKSATMVHMMMRENFEGTNKLLNGELPTFGKMI